MPVSSLPGATVEGTALGWIEPTPENSHVVDLRATGDDAFHEAMLADTMAAVDSGKAVVFGDIAADKDIFSIGRIDDRYLIFVGDHPPATYADLKAAMRHGSSAIEGEY